MKEGRDRGMQWQPLVRKSTEGKALYRYRFVQPVCLSVGKLYFPFIGRLSRVWEKSCNFLKRKCAILGKMR